MDLADTPAERKRVESRGEFLLLDLNFLSETGTQDTMGVVSRLKPWSYWVSRRAL